MILSYENLFVKPSFKYHICNEMKNTAIENKLQELKGIIRKMNTSTAELINLSAIVEINLRKSVQSDSEIQNLEKEIDNLLNQYNRLEQAKEN